MFFNIFASLILLVGNFGSIVTDTDSGEDAAFDQFPVTQTIAVDEPALEQVAGASTMSPEYTVYTYALPLLKQDYYWGKYNNASIGAKEVNRMPVLSAGNRVSLIGSGYLTIGSKGYVNPGRGYYYASGLCWVASTMGGMMDRVNKQFRAQYGMDLFVFRRGDRSGHGHRYVTYASSNNGYGYAVMKVGTRKGRPDYTFQVNPNVKNIAGFGDLKVKIRIVASSNYKGAYKGQALSAILYSNKDIFKKAAASSAVKSSSTEIDSTLAYGTSGENVAEAERNLPLPGDPSDPKKIATPGFLSCSQICYNSGVSECVGCFLKIF